MNDSSNAPGVATSSPQETSRTNNTKAEAQLRDKLQSEIFEVSYRDLRAHAGRGALFLVDTALPLLDAALAIAEDRTAEVERWIARSQLRRPTPKELTAWEAELDAGFLSVIVQPFVIAEKLN